jgi:outer membrane protein assembly factor BamB
MFCQNPAHTGEGSGQVSNPTVLWKFPIGKDLMSYPTVVNNTVYVSSVNRTMIGGHLNTTSETYALNASSGQQIWIYHYPDYLSGSHTSSAIAGNVVYSAGREDIYALDAATGVELASFESGTSSSLCIADGVLYIGRADGNLFALDIENPNAITKLWNYKVADSILSSPAVADGNVYFISAKGNVYALDALNGHENWSIPLCNVQGTSSSSSPLISNGILYVGAPDRNIYALNATNGAKLWAFRVGDEYSALSSPVILDRTAFIGSNFGNVYALDSKTGAKLWSFHTDGHIDCPLACGSGVVYVTSSDKNLYALRASSGEKIWSYQISDSVYDFRSSPVLVNGVIYVCSDDGYILAIGSSEISASSTDSPGTPIEITPLLAVVIVCVVVATFLVLAVWKSRQTLMPFGKGLL